MKMISTILGTFFLLAANAAEYKVQPGDGSFARAAKQWKSGDTILLAPGEYSDHYSGGRIDSPVYTDQTIKAMIPGTAIFRGDRPAPKFVFVQKNIWKAPMAKMPETIFERDTLRPYEYVGSIAEMQFKSGVWTYDPKTKTVYIRTTDSCDPAKHCLTVGVSPYSGISFYCKGDAPGNKNIHLEGFLVTGFYSRVKFPDQRLPSSQKKVPWGVIVNHTGKNVVIRDVTAMLNGQGIGFSIENEGGTIDNCRAWGNRNPFMGSGGGIGIFHGAKACSITNCIGADNEGHDIFLYHDKTAADVAFSYNKAYGVIRVKTTKAPGFAVRNCVASSFSHIDLPRHLKNSVCWGYIPNSDVMNKENLLFRYEKALPAPDAVFADPENLDCRLQSDVPQDVAARASEKAPDSLYFLKKDGNDSANGRSVKTAFKTIDRSLKALTPCSELFIIDPVKGDLKLKGMRSIVIHGRGKYAVAIQGKILLENCENVTLERLMPDEIILKNCKNITITQSLTSIKAEKVGGLRLTHNYFKNSTLRDCGNCFVTANVIEQSKAEKVNGWFDYNAYAEKIPAGEKHSFIAKAILGKKGTFRNAELFDGRAIDAMPVGPYRRQVRNVKLSMDAPQIHSLSVNSGVITLTGNIPFSGTLFWGNDSSCKNKIVLLEPACRASIGLSGLKPGQKYYFRFKTNAQVPDCFSNAELTHTKNIHICKSKVMSFLTPDKMPAPKEYFVSPEGNDRASGDKTHPFASIGHAVNQLLPGDTLTIRGGKYIETINVCVSGTPEHPITIRGAKGEKVYLCGGYGNALLHGFRIFNQSNITVENMTIAGKSMDETNGYGWSTVLIKDSEDITYRKCLIGGATARFEVHHGKNILLEDSVVTGGHGALDTYNTSLTIRHCTFAFAGVLQIGMRNTNGERCIVEDSIICDMLNMKTMNPVIFVHDVAAFSEKNNCYFLRMPEAKRLIFGWNFNGKEIAEKNNMREISKFPALGRRLLPYHQYLRELKREGTSFFANPGIKARPHFVVTYRDMDEWEKNWKKNQNRSYKEISEIPPETLRDFRSFLPSNPEVIKRGCGPRVE